MKRTVLIVFFIFTLIFSLGAGTVMIFTTDSWLDEDNRRGAEYIIYTLEDGIMETLFDNGFILFNDYALPFAEADYNNRDRVAMRIARSGGADYLMELIINYENTNDRRKQDLPHSVSFRLCKITETGFLTEGEIFSRDFSKGIESKYPEICTLMGKELAARILRYL